MKRRTPPKSRRVWLNESASLTASASYEATDDYPVLVIKDCTRSIQLDFCGGDARKKLRKLINLLEDLDIRLVLQTNRGDE